MPLPLVILVALISYSIGYATRWLTARHAHKATLEQAVSIARSEAYYQGWTEAVNATNQGETHA